MTAPFSNSRHSVDRLLLVGGIVVISRMTVTTDLTALLPRSADPTQELLVAQLRDGVAARLMLIALEGAAPEPWPRPVAGSPTSFGRAACSAMSTTEIPPISPLSVTS